MTTLGASIIAIGAALVCAGVLFQPRPPQTDPAVLDGPVEFRMVLDALDEQDRRDENRDLGAASASEQQTDPTAETTTQPDKQHRPHLG